MQTQNNSDEALTMRQAESDLPWTGERLVPSLSGQIAAEHLHRYAIAHTLAEGKDVLDIACGEGYGSALLAQRARSVTGVDISRQTVEHAARKYVLPNIRYLHGECLAIPLADSSVDMVVSFETIEHITEQERFLSEVLRVLRPGGQLLVSTPEIAAYNQSNTSTNAFHLKELSREEFESLLRSRFANVSIFGQRFAPFSVVLPEETNQSPAVGVFHGDYGKIDFSSSLPQPIYFLAVCSNSPLPIIEAGCFEFHTPSNNTTPSDMFLQVFGDDGTGYHESLSQSAQLTQSGWQTIRFEFHAGFHKNPNSRLRIDPANRVAAVAVSSIKVSGKDGAIFYKAENQHEFNELLVSGLKRHPSESGACFFAIHDDPQIFLPVIKELSQQPWTLEVELKIENIVSHLLNENARLESDLSAQAEMVLNLQANVAGLQNNVAQLQSETARLTSELSASIHATQEWKMKASALKKTVNSAQQWQQRSWITKAFHRWRPPGSDQKKKRSIQKLNESLRKRSKALWGLIRPS